MKQVGATEPRYTIRLRHAGQRDGVALVIEDRAGDAYIYTRRGLSCRLSGRYGLPTFAPTLHRIGWVLVPLVAPYSLEGLRRLLGPTSA